MRKARGKRKLGESDAEVEDMTDFRYRHHCVPHYVYELAGTLNARKDGGKRRALLETTGFSNVMKIEDWKGLPKCFVAFIVNNYDSDENAVRLNGDAILKIYKEDVARVYGLPTGGTTINAQDLKDCKQAAIDKLREDLKLPKRERSTLVTIQQLKLALSKLEDDVLWCKGAICFMLGTLLTPRNHGEITLHYAELLSDFGNLRSYDWCKHILDYIGRGIPKKCFKSPKADFHLLMINYLDRMGKNSKVSTGSYVIPTAHGWKQEGSEANLNLFDSVCGLENASPYGWRSTISAKDGNGLPNIAFDPDLCPVSKAPGYLLYCKSQVGMWTNVIGTLEARINSAGIWSAELKKQKNKNKKSAKKENKEDQHTSTSFDGVSGAEGETLTKVVATTSPTQALKPVVNDARIEETNGEEISITTTSKNEGRLEADTQHQKKPHPRVITQTLKKANTQPKNDDTSNATFNMLDNVATNTCSSGQPHLDDRAMEDTKVRLDDVVKNDYKFTCYNEDTQPDPNFNLLDEAVHMKPWWKARPLGKTTAPPEEQGNVSVHVGTPEVPKKTPCAETTNEIGSRQMVTPRTKERIVAETVQVIWDNIEEFQTPEDYAVVRHSTSFKENLEERFEEVRWDKTAPEFTTIDETAKLNMEDWVNKTGKIPTPLAYVEISDDENDGVKREPVQNSDRSPFKYISRRLTRQTKYLDSPFDDHVYESPLPDKQKMLVTFIWSPNEGWYDQLYKNCENDVFTLVRTEFWTLQERERVSSFVIDVWTAVLNARMVKRGMTKLYMTLQSSLATLRQVEANPTEHISENIASHNFTVKMRPLNWIQHTLVFDNLDMIIFPAYALDHFVTYVLNLRDEKFEFLNSLSTMTRNMRTGNYSVFALLGYRLMREAMCYLDLMYLMRRKPCPHTWANFTWSDPVMPEQPDVLSCGIYTMKFCEEWDGSSETMPSFNTYNPNLELEELEAFTNELRVQLCLSIITDDSNKLKSNVRARAKEFAAKLLTKPTTSHHASTMNEAPPKKRN